MMYGVADLGRVTLSVLPIHIKYALPLLWNTLPIHLRQCDSLGQFKWLLKTYLFGDWDRGAL